MTYDGVERDAEAFSSIGAAVWWCITTFTTVGFGDISPVTVRGQIAASFAMFIGIFFLAMPLAIIGGSFADSWARMDARAEEIFAERRRMAAEIKVSHDNPMTFMDDEEEGTGTQLMANRGGESAEPDLPTVAHGHRLSVMAHLLRAQSCLEEAESVSGRGHPGLQTDLTSLLERMESATEALRPPPETVE